jgi:acetyl-CoA C-acetyltransferase
MPTVTNTVEISAPPERVFGALLDFHRYDQWLTIHDGWPEGAPADPEVGASFTQKVKLMGMPAVVRWTVAELDSPGTLVIAGAGPMGATMRSAYSLESVDGGTRVHLETGLEGGPLSGPMGSMVIKSSEKAGDESLRKLKALVS